MLKYSLARRLLLQKRGCQGLIPEYSIQGGENDEKNNNARQSFNWAYQSISGFNPYSEVIDTTLEDVSPRVGITSPSSAILIIFKSVSSSSPGRTLFSCFYYITIKINFLMLKYSFGKYPLRVSLPEKVSSEYWKGKEVGAMERITKLVKALTDLVRAITDLIRLLESL